MKALNIIESNLNNLDIITSFIDELVVEKDINIFLLDGEVGMGKTSLVDKYSKNKGLDNINSPSFTFIHEYSSEADSIKIYHYDLYLKNDLESKAKLLESLSQDGIHFIEWGTESIFQNLKLLDFKVALIKIHSKTDSSRIYEFFV